MLEGNGSRHSQGEVLGATDRDPSVDILAEGLSKEFDGRMVVSDASFTVPQGQIFGFIGPSGSGKTTTIRMLNGVYRPTRGRVEVLGKDPSRLTRSGRALIGYLPQQFVLYPNLSVMENMRFMASLYGLRPIARRRPIREALEFVELWDARGRLASELSGGMQRRLELAAALVHSPRLIFADEPTAGVDPVLREHLWDGFKQLRAEGKTLFVTTQYVTEAEYCDHVALMSEGRIVASDTPENLRRAALGGEAIDVTAPALTWDTAQELRALQGVVGAERLGPQHWRFYVDNAGVRLAPLVSEVQQRAGSVSTVEEYRPTFDEVFVRLLEQAEGTDGRRPHVEAPGETDVSDEQEAERTHR